MTNGLALFDFDGTITEKDSFYLFLRYCFNFPTLFLGFVTLFPFLLCYKLGLMNNGKAKEKVACYFFKGWSKEQFRLKAESFASEVLPTVIRPTAKARLDWHRENGHRIIVVSASFQEWLKPWCEAECLELISTELEYINNKFSGNFLTLNCSGTEKVRRVENFIGEEKYYTYAYGDSAGDTEMLAFAEESYLNFINTNGSAIR